MRTIKTAALMLLTAMMATSCFFSDTSLDYSTAIIGQWQEYKEVYYDVNPPETVYLDQVQYADYYVFTFYSNGEAILETIEKGGSRHLVQKVMYQVSGSYLIVQGYDFNQSLYINKLNSSELVLRSGDENTDVYFRRVG